MYVEIVPNRSSRPAILIRVGKREGKKVKKTTIANISHWPMHRALALRALLKGKTLVSSEDVFGCLRTVPHGHVELVLAMMGRLGIAALLDPKRSPHRSRILALVAQRIIDPASRHDTTRLWHDTTLAAECDVEDSNCDDLHEAMDWLLDRQKAIERRLVRRHLHGNGQALYNVSSSYYEGLARPLTSFGYNRYGKRRLPFVVYGLLSDDQGRPVSIQAWPGNTADPSTVPEQASMLRDGFKLRKVVLVGDPRMPTDSTIDHLRQHPGLGWIRALGFDKLRKLAPAIQPSLFDDRDLAEIRDDSFPGERLIVCRNPLLAERQRRRREELLAATEEPLRKIAAEVTRRTRKPLSAVEISREVGRAENKHRMAKHFAFEIGDGRFSWERRAESIEKDAALDGIHVIRTDQAGLSSDDVVRSYKGLTRVESAFSRLETADPHILPMRHRLEPRVRANLLLCMLAYYVEWHLRKALAPLLFDDEELDEDRRTRNPVRPAEVSPSAKRKKQRRTAADGLPLHSFPTLMEHMGTRCRLFCYMESDPENTAFERLADPTPVQRRAFDLVGMFPIDFH